MKWESIFKRSNHTSLTKVKKIYRSLNIKSSAKIISVVGTNGKGSVVSYLAQGLMSKNKKVGVFTSPHLLKPNERIKINDQQITDKEAFAIIKTLPADLHFFATMFLTAMIYFHKQQVDVIILEAGIGGKKDSTNALKFDYGVVTSVALDHQKLLGDSLHLIAKQKAGIINKGIKLFIPSELKTTLQDVFINKVITTKGASVKIVNNIHDSYQQRNKMLAREVLKWAFGINFGNFKALPGRTEIMQCNNVHYIFDVGHNLDAFKATIKELSFQKINFDNVVICLSKSKNKKGIIELFKKKKVYGYQLNDTFLSAEDLKVQALKEPWNFTFKTSTLFIGSFYFIEKLWKELKKE